MTGIERLRALANGDASHEIGNGWFLTAETFESIADQIERETLPRPRFEDGEPVQFGDEYLGYFNGVFEVENITVWSDGDYEINGHMLSHKDERLRRPEPPDTWERLTADIERCGDSCAYFRRNCDDGGSACRGCPCHGADDACMVIVMRDVLGRAKKLAGVEE